MIMKNNSSTRLADTILFLIHEKINANNFDLNKPQQIYNLANAIRKKSLLSADTKMPYIQKGFEINQGVNIRSSFHHAHYIEFLLNEVLAAISPYVNAHFDSLSIKQKMVVLTTFKYFNLLDEKLFKTFLTEFEKSYIGK